MQNLMSPGNKANSTPKNSQPGEQTACELLRRQGRITLGAQRPAQ